MLSVRSSHPPVTASFLLATAVTFGLTGCTTDEVPTAVGLTQTPVSVPSLAAPSRTYPVADRNFLKDAYARGLGEQVKVPGNLCGLSVDGAVVVTSRRTEDWSEVVTGFATQTGKTLWELPNTSCDRIGTAGNTFISDPGTERSAEAPVRHDLLTGEASTTFSAFGGDWANVEAVSADPDAPVIFQVDAQDTDRVVVAADPHTGRELWRAPDARCYYDKAQLVCDERVIDSATGKRGGRPIDPNADWPKRREPGFPQALDRDGRVTAWTEDGEHARSQTVQFGHVAANTADGQTLLLWEELPATNGDPYSAPLLIRTDGTLLAALEDGDRKIDLQHSEAGLVIATSSYDIHGDSAGESQVHIWLPPETSPSDG